MDERIYSIRRGSEGTSIRRLDSMNKREAVMNRGKAARTDCRIAQKISGGDAPWGHTRSHPEHDG